jgi:putative two-component system response regulator
MNKQQATVLIVDDEAVIRKVLYQRLSGEGYLCQEAGNADEAVQKLRDDSTSLVILDIKMPGRPGTELLPEIKSDYPDTAVIMATAIIDTHTAIECMKQGAYDYITKPFNLDEVVLNVNRALEKRRLEIENRNYKEHLERMVEARTRQLRHAVKQIKVASLDTVYRLSRAAEYKDEDTGAHIKRMSQYAATIARKIDLDDIEVENILYAAPMHDVGKIGIPDRILLKPGELDAKEWEIMKQHTIIGAQIMAGADVEFIKLAEVIALTHHEKWDGSGYPKGLQGSAIPLVGRIVAIADVFDALTSKRPYREPMSIDEACDIISRGRGKHFDPDVVDAFFGTKEEIMTIKGKYQDEADLLLKTAR